jgi:hypothetical protein
MSHTPSRNRAGDLNHHRRMTTEIIIAPSPDLRPAPLFTPTPKAAKRVLEFFTGQINNDRTRRTWRVNADFSRELVDLPNLLSFAVKS